MNELLTSVFVLGLAAATPTATPPASATSPLSRIYACAEKTDSTERLACFDSAVAAVKVAEARSEIIMLDQPRVAAVRREAFGFRIPSLPRFSFGTLATAPAGEPTPASEARDESEEVQTFTVARLGQAGNRVAIFLENGNVWHLTDAGDLNAPRRPPFNVSIRSAAMGSYLLTIEGRNKGYRVRRVQ